MAWPPRRRNPAAGAGEVCVRTKFLLIALLAVIPVTGLAASLEQDYIASRDRYIATFKRLDKPGKTDDRLFAREQRAMADLEKQLRQIIGPLAFDGVAAEGKINLGALTPGNMGFEVLDGLVFSSNDRRILVSTDGLLNSWLRAHRSELPRAASGPQGLAAIVKSEDFYNLALDTDAHIFGYGEVPIAGPANAAVASAMLVGRSQDAAPRTPGEVLVTVVQGQRVFVMSRAVETGPIPACDAVADAYDKKIEALAPDAAERARDEKDAAYGRCFAERAKEQDFFAGLVKQAQALVALLPSR
jgi:hypothetical protein